MLDGDRPVLESFLWRWLLSWLAEDVLGVWPGQGVVEEASRQKRERAKLRYGEQHRQVEGVCMAGL